MTKGFSPPASGTTGWLEAGDTARRRPALSGETMVAPRRLKHYR